MVDAPTETVAQQASRAGVKSTVIGIFVNAFLAAVKLLAGIFGNSYALIADAIESASDILSSIIVLVGIKMAAKPADDSHPYGHGKFEPLAGAVVSLMLMAAAIGIAVESVREIITPHHAPAAFTLLVLLGVIIIKENLYRFVSTVGNEIESTAIKTDAWHHRSDVITSAAAFIGIAIAVVGGEGYESADDFAALIASGIIAVNAVLLLKPSLFELLDTAPDPMIAKRVCAIAATVPGVLGTHTCHVRKVGFDFYVDLDVLCDPLATIREGHEIAHRVGDVVHKEIPSITNVLVHVEPVDDYGRRSKN